MTYGYLCEDSALENFIDETLKQLGPKTKCKEFIRDNKFYEKSPSGRNSGHVKKLYSDTAKAAIGIFELDLFMIAYDYDDKDTDNYKNNIDILLNKIHIKARNRSIFSIPIQSVEYWLWYVKYDSKERRLKSNELETNANFNRDKAKAEVYDKSLEDGKYTGQSGETELRKAKEILQKLDTDRLQELSPSFKHFVEQIQNFCNHFSGK